jgi:4'-phosphopantetheinyl transferase
MTLCGDPHEDLLAEYRNLLSGEERTRERRFCCERDRRRYRVTRALVRTVLSRYAPIPPTAWRFVSNGHGKPEIASDDLIRRELRFNIAHSGEMVLLGVTRRRSLGIDVEKMNGSQEAIAIAEQVFSSAEIQSLRRRGRLVGEECLALWTLKEAYVKARGLGLSLALSSCQFMLWPPGRVHFRVAESLGDEATRWRFWQLQPICNYLAALCAERVAGSRQTISLRRVVPLVAEDSIECHVIRQSCDGLDCLDWQQPER